MAPNPTLPLRTASLPLGRIGYYKGGNIHFIYVSDLYDNEKRSYALKLWGNLCKGHVLAYETTGDHIAMLNKNNAVNTAKIIDEILEGE